MIESAVLDVHAQYVENLEELVQCPVCYQRPVGPVSQCIQGHHLCSKCKSMLSSCPTCKSFFSVRARNYVVEELCRKIDETISLLIVATNNKDDESIALTYPTMVATATMSKTTIDTQTNNNNDDGPDDTPKASIIFSGDTTDDYDNVNEPIVEEYRLSNCGICQIEFHAESMYRHVREYHKSAFKEMTFHHCRLNSEKIRMELELKYNLNESHDYALYCLETGVLFLKMRIDQGGDFFVKLQAASVPHRNSEFTYSLNVGLFDSDDIDAEPVDYDYNTQTGSVSSPKEHKFSKKFFEPFFREDKITLRKNSTRSISLELFIYCE